VLRICDTCGWTYVRDSETDRAFHRSVHRKIVAVLKPRPDPVVAKYAYDGRVGVIWPSPAVLHRRLNAIAREFRREMEYDFVHWGNPEKDRDAVGFILADADHRAVGGCAFRWRKCEQAPHWGLQWAWVAPPHRRQGHFSRHWSYFEDRFEGFRPEPPLSEAMTALVGKHRA
jgi:hypothetical protein